MERPGRDGRVAINTRWTGRLVKSGDQANHGSLRGARIRPDLARCAASDKLHGGSNTGSGSTRNQEPLNEMFTRLRNANALMGKCGECGFRSSYTERSAVLVRREPFSVQWLP